ncbi:hypothetical protein CC1G_13824 [Coprinopsis cinerea okayama7|uniref:Uncharacterized protein n=1 Tax=Coprinopsis cinerea (strain Okayama-7 / 130 / ATCC MYA-4618 / FGSC 9003) TaxID=240176 RepID=D6RKE9_COPC7|nr:hypothetical protein CC1G_13824 [Coprinopsis cinerea okayama7\|eukprot:XP_002911789.1 hypothetical protein CC1G_13824 [Coprinopsis cinerea okayama7\
MVLGPCFQFLSLFLVIFSSLGVADAQIVNRTIDDWFGDSQTNVRPRFLPTTTGVWKDETCRDCAINPDTSRAFRGTYHAATYSPELGSMSIEMSFEGIAIHVFFILANDQGTGITTITDCDFILDDEPPVNFRHAPDLTSTDILYNQLVFSRNDLPNGNHTLLIRTEGVDHNVYVNFDYAIYTHVDDPAGVSSSRPRPSSQGLSSSASASESLSSSASQSPSASNSGSTSRSPSASGSSTGGAPLPDPSTNPGDTVPGGSAEGTDDDSESAATSSAPVGAIAGGVVGGLAALGLIAFLVFCLRRRKRYGAISMDPDMTQARPYPSPPTGGNPPIQFYSPVESSIPDGATGNDSVAPSGSGNAQGFYQGSVNGPYIKSPNGSTGNAQASGGPSAMGGPSSMGGNPVGGPPTFYPPKLQPQRYIPQGSTTDGSVYSSAYGGIAPTSPSNSSNQQTSTTSTSNHALIPLSSQQEAIRRARQQELDQQLRTVEQEMDELGQDLKRGRSLRRRTEPRATGGEEMTVEEMRAQMELMQQQIEILRANQRSDWAEGLTDDPPPGYTPRAQPTLSNRAPLPPIPTQVSSAVT